jgi:hypothetical protein
MKKQEILAKWQSIFASMNAPLLEAEFEKDITELLGDEDTIDSVLANLMSSGLEIHNDLQATQMSEQVRKALNNELD